MKGNISPFIMELPAYHCPRFKSLMIHLWDKTKHFVEKAFTIILASTIVIWFLTNFSWGWKFLPKEVDGELVNLNIDKSILGSIGMLIQPLFTPLGFGSQLNSYGWVFAVAAICGLIAKENVISTFGTLAAVFGAGIISSDNGVAEVTVMIANTGITIPALISFIAFNMTTIPCFAAVATARAELKKGTFKWTLLFWLVTSYIVGTIIYVVGSWWWTAFIALAISIISAIIISRLNKRRKV
jgi:ferrous iron transport protein B